MRKSRGRAWLGLLLCYLVAVLVWFAIGLFSLARNGIMAGQGAWVQREYRWLDDLSATDGIHVPDGYGELRRFAATDSDPKLLLDFPNGEYVTGLVFRAKALNRGSGAVNLYYSTRPDDEMSESRKLWARQLPDGSWYFDLGGRTVYALRLDPGTVAAAVWQMEGITLNPNVPLAAYFVPDWQEGLVLLLVPLLAWAVLREGIAFAAPVVARRRFDSRWRGEITVKKRKAEPRRVVGRPLAPDKAGKKADQGAHRYPDAETRSAAEAPDVSAAGQEPTLPEQQTAADTGLARPQDET